MISGASLILRNWPSVFSLDGGWIQKNLIVPEESLNTFEKLGFERVGLIFSEIVSNYDSMPLTIGVMKEDGLCKVYGGRNAKLLFSRKALSSLCSLEQNSPKEIYKTSWNDLVASYPSESKELTGLIKSKSEYDLAVLIGLYDENKFTLTDDELYFVLCHEIFGHYENYDNEKEMVVILSALLTSFIFLQRFVPEVFPGFHFLLCTLFTSLVCQKFEFFKEQNADIKGFSYDDRAKRGAQSYFKKMLINDIAEQRYLELTGKGYSRWKEKYNLGHPSSQLRYESLADSGSIESVDVVD